MNPLDPLTRLLGTLRTERIRKGRTDDPVAERPVGTPRTTAPPQTSRAVTLEQRLKARLALTADRSPQRIAALLVETVLSSELGEQLTFDPAFAALKDRVSSQLLADPELTEELAALANRLGDAA
jgi:hypothetical protein